MKIILFSFFVSSNPKISTFDMNCHFVIRLEVFPIGLKKMLHRLL